MRACNWLLHQRRIPVPSLTYLQREKCGKRLNSAVRQRSLQLLLIHIFTIRVIPLLQKLAILVEIAGVRAHTCMPYTYTYAKPKTA